MASVHKDRGTWCIRWREDGRNRKLRGIGSKAQAEAQARRIEAELATRAPMEPGALVSFDEAIDRYCAALPDATARHKENFTKTCKRVIANHGWRTWSDMTPPAVIGLLPFHARCLRSLLRWGLENGQPVHPRALVTSKPKNRRKPQKPLPDQADIDAAIATADAWHPANGTIAHLIATYGHRAQSLVGLKVEAWDPERRTLTLPVKSGDIHRHPVLPATAERLNQLTRGEQLHAPLFPNHLGVPWKAGRDFVAWWAHCVTKGQQLGILDLRRSAISRMLVLGLDPKTVASITGHRTVSLLLNTYARTTESRQQAAIEALTPRGPILGGVPQMFPTKAINP